MEVLNSSGDGGETGRECDRERQEEGVKREKRRKAETATIISKGLK